MYTKLYRLQWTSFNCNCHKMLGLWAQIALLPTTISMTQYTNMEPDYWGASPTPRWSIGGGGGHPGFYSTANYKECCSEYADVLFIPYASVADLDI